MPDSKPSTHPTPPTSWRDHTLRTSRSKQTRSNVQAKQPNLYADHTVQAASPHISLKQSTPSTHPTPPTSCRDHTLRTSPSKQTRSIVQAKQPNLHVDHTVQASALRVFLKSFDNPMKQSTPSTHPTPPTSWRDYVLRTSHSEPKRINVQAKQPNLYVDRTVEASSPPRVFQDAMTFLWNKANPAPSLQHRPRAQTTHLEHPLVNTQEERYKQNS